MSRLVRSIKNVANGYSASQVKVRNATANKDGGPTQAELQEIAELTYTNHELFLIMDMLDKRLNDKGKLWRHVLKSLIVLDYLVHYGSDNVIIWCQENLYIIKTLREFQHKDENGRDQGAAIRARAKDLTSLITDPARLRRERMIGGPRYGGRRPRRHSGSYSDRYDGRRDMRRSASWDRDARRDRDSANDSARRRSDGAANDMDDDLKRAIELSKQTAEEENRRRALSSTSQDDLRKAIELSQQNSRDLGAASSLPNVNNPMLIDTLTELQPYHQPPQPMLQYNTGYQPQYNAGLPTEYDIQQYHIAQQQFLAQQQELQRQWEAQEAQLRQIEQMQLQAEAQQAQAGQLQQLQPLKTGSNNPFAAFAQQQQQQLQQQQQQQQDIRPQRTGNRSRRNSFNVEHMNQLEGILSNEAPADTFGNTGSQRIPAHHTPGIYMNSAGHHLTEYMTGKLQAQQTSSTNPFSTSHYGDQQMQPAHTGYGFGNAGSSQPGNTLIDF